MLCDLIFKVKFKVEQNIDSPDPQQSPDKTKMIVLIKTLILPQTQTAIWDITTNRYTRAKVGEAIPPRLSHFRKV